MNWKWAWVLLLGLLAGCDNDKQPENDQEKEPPAPHKTEPKAVTPPAPTITPKPTPGNKGDIDALKKEIEELRKQLAPLDNLSLEELVTRREKEQNIRRYFDIVNNILKKITLDTLRDEVHRLAGEPDDINGDTDEYLLPEPFGKQVVTYRENKLSAIKIEHTYYSSKSVLPFIVNGRALGGTITIATVDGSGSTSITTKAGETGEQVRDCIVKAAGEWIFSGPRYLNNDTSPQGKSATVIFRYYEEKSLTLKSTDPGIVFPPAVTEAEAKYDAVANRVDLKWSKLKGLKYAAVHRDGKKIGNTLAGTYTDQLPKDAPPPRVYQIVSYSAVGAPGDMATVTIEPAGNLNK